MMSYDTYDQSNNNYFREAENSSLPISILIDMFTEYGAQYNSFGKCMSGAEIGIKIRTFYPYHLQSGWVNSHPNLRRIGTLMHGGFVDFNNISGRGNGLYQLNILSSDINLHGNSISSYSGNMHYEEDYVNPRTLSFYEIKEMHSDLSKSFRIINGKYGPQIERRVIIPILANSITRIRRLQKRATFVGYDIIAKLLEDNVITYHPEERDIFILNNSITGNYQLDESTLRQKIYLENKEKELNALELKQKEAFLEQQKQLVLKKEELIAKEIEQANTAVLEQQMLLDLKQKKLALLEKEEQVSIAIKEKEREKSVNLKIIVAKSCKKTCSKDFRKNNSEVMRRSPRLSKNK